ncbi:MAG: bacteriohemerythrin [Ignavibacteria bacterium]|nr:bacteriohemerythrin [Ignavibacteria bacterium]
MAFITWNDSFSVGIAKIDNQHKRLIQIINKLDDAMKEGKGKEILSEVLNELILYVNTHFKTEEEYMTQYNYDEYEQHRYEHEKLTDEVKRFYDDFKGGRVVLSVQIMNFLRNWLMDHIVVKDKKLGKFLNEKGLN